MAGEERVAHDAHAGFRWHPNCEDDACRVTAAEIEAIGRLPPSVYLEDNAKDTAVRQRCVMRDAQWNVEPR